jgi:hypothetical protein
MGLILLQSLIRVLSWNVAFSWQIFANDNFGIQYFYVSQLKVNYKQDFAKGTFFRCSLNHTFFDPRGYKNRRLSEVVKVLRRTCTYVS